MVDYQNSLAKSKKVFLEGMIFGHRLADSVKSVLAIGERYGEEFAKDNEFFFARLSEGENDFDSLLIAVVEQTIDGLTEGRKINQIVETIMIAGAAYGFEMAKEQAKV